VDKGKFMRHWKQPFFVALLISGATNSGPASAAQLRLLVSNNMSGIIPILTRIYEQKSGDHISLSFASPGAIRTKTLDGEKADAVIVVRPIIDALVKAGKVGSEIRNIADSPLAVMIPSGRTPPDISSSAAFKNALLSAKSIAYTNPSSGGASGIFVADVISRLGLTDALKNKTKLVPVPGKNVADLVASGGADIGVNQMREVMNHPGIEFLTPLPPDLSPKTQFVVGAGIEVGSTEKAPALEFIAFLRSPEAIRLIETKGMRPFAGK
jgi:molybdate transport system substrate-binding protein